MNGEYQAAEAIGIIGSADGPTSVLLTGKTGKMPFKVRINRYIYKCRRKKAEKKIVAGAHTLEEVVTYAVDKYGAIEVGKRPGEFPAASHVYEIKVGSNCLEIEVDYTKDTFGVSFSASKKELKYCRRITKDLYLYYGVSEDDIRKKTGRYFSLLGALNI